MLPFSVTIGPNDEVAGVPCLIGKIFCYGFLVLGSVRVSIICAGRCLDAPFQPYIMDRSDDRGVEKGLGWRGAPVLVLWGELNLSKMPSHTGHGDSAMAP